MQIYIMTRGRVGKQITLGNLPPSLYKRISLVVPDGEQGHKVPPGVGVIFAPPIVKNYSDKFQWILEGLPLEQGLTWDNRVDTNTKAVIMDDDLVFSKPVIKDGKVSLVTIRDPEELVPMFDLMEKMLEEIPLVGVHPRQMGQNAPQPFVWNGRIICIQGINRKLIGTVKVNELPILADVVLNCTLLSRGQPNALITTHFQDHAPCQAPGGCSIYRTPDMQREAAEYIARRWPGFARVVTRKPKTAKWMGDERIEFTTQWKKLYEAGMQFSAGRGGNPDKGSAV